MEFLGLISLIALFWALMFPSIVVGWLADLVSCGALRSLERYVLDHEAYIAQRAMYVFILVTILWGVL